MKIEFINVLTPLYEKWLLEQNPDKINWIFLSRNKNENIWKDNQYILK